MRKRSGDLRHAIERRWRPVFLHQLPELPEFGGTTKHPPLSATAAATDSDPLHPNTIHGRAPFAETPEIIADFNVSRNLLRPPSAQVEN